MNSAAYHIAWNSYIKDGRADSSAVDFLQSAGDIINNLEDNLAFKGFVEFGSEFDATLEVESYIAVITGISQALLLLVNSRTFNCST